MLTMLSAFRVQRSSAEILARAADAHHAAGTRRVSAARLAPTSGEVDVRPFGLLAQPIEDGQAIVVAGHGLTADEADRTLMWFTASTIRGKRGAQSRPLRVRSRMPTGSRRA